MTDKEDVPGGRKDDSGKPCVWRGVVNYFPRAIQSVAEVSTFGSQKYAWGGWKHVPDGFERYQDAKYRHALAFSKGETYDPESKLLHLAHEAWGALAALELYIKEQEDKDKDQKDNLQEIREDLEFRLWAQQFLNPIRLS